MSVSRFIFFALLNSIIAAGVGAQEKSHSDLYETCLKKSDVTPKEAFEDAIQWQGEGGGNPAKHCAASALMALGLYVEAAKRLESMAQSIKKGAHFKVRILEQAVLAWLSAGDPVRAEAAATSGLTLTKNVSTLLIGRARARAELGDYAGAKVDLDVVLTMAPNHATALAFRAAALRYLDKRDSALADANAALTINPNHTEALLERGILRRLANDNTSARADWLKLLELAPDSGAATIARLNLEKMDLNAQKSD